MKSLVADDDFTCRLLLQDILKQAGEVQLAVNGEEAVAAFIEAAESEEPFDLVCLDIMMPVMDGQQALEAIRGIERQKGIAPEQGVKIVMTTAVADMANVAGAFAGLCNSYLLKPIRKEALLKELKELGLAG